MKLSYGGQCGRNGFMVYVGSGNGPVLSVFHEIRCHPANIGTFIRKDSDHAGTSADFTIQSLNHIGRRDFSSVQHGECIKSQRIFQSVFKALNRFRKALGIGVDHIIFAFANLIIRYLYFPSLIIVKPKNPLQFSSQYKMEDAVLLLAQYYFRFLFS